MRHINFAINLNGFDPCISEKRMNFSLSDLFVLLCWDISYYKWANIFEY